MLKVKSFKNGFGITDGKKWFCYYYPTKVEAEALLPSFTAEKVKVNIAYAEPLTLVRK